MTKPSKMASGLLVLLLVLAGCATPESALLGTYTTTITKEERYDLAGPWKLTITEDNRYRWTHKDLVADEGHCTITENQIVFNYEDGPYGCFYFPVYTYTWAFDGEAMNLTPVEDGCLVREFVLTLHPWYKQD